MMELQLDYDGIADGTMMVLQMELRWHYRWNYDGASVHACACNQNEKSTSVDACAIMGVKKKKAHVRKRAPSWGRFLHTNVTYIKFLHLIFYL